MYFKDPYTIEYFHSESVFIPLVQGLSKHPRPSATSEKLHNFLQNEGIKITYETFMDGF